MTARGKCLKLIVGVLVLIASYSNLTAKERLTKLGVWDVGFAVTGGFVDQNYRPDGPTKVRMPAYMSGERYNSPMAAYYGTLKTDELTDNPLLHGAMFAHLALEAQSAGLRLFCKLIMEHRGTSYGTYAMRNIAVLPTFLVSVDTSFVIGGETFHAGVEGGNFDDHKLYEGLTIYNMDVQGYNPVVVACTPETNLDGQQAATPVVSKPGSDTVTSLTSDPLAVVLVEPPPGSVDIPPNIAALVVRFAEAVQTTGVASPFLLRPATGDALAVMLGPTVACDGVCYRLLPAAVLTPSMSYTLEAVGGGLQFFDGKPSPAGSAGSFTTANATDAFAPRVLSFTVALAEGCLSAHVAADEAVRAEITVAAGDGQAVLSRDIFASVADFGSRLPDLPTNVPGQATLRVFDRAGNGSASAPAAVQLPPQLPQLVITEVLPNPAGSETTQEFVEIYNAGSEPVAWTGSSSRTRPAAMPCPRSPWRRGFAVLVAEKYDPAEGSDVAPAEAAYLVRVPGRIGSDGLANAGEIVELRAATGDVISRYGGWIDTSPAAWSGKSVKRSSPQACDGVEAWSANPTPATPGW